MEESMSMVKIEEVLVCRQEKPTHKLIITGLTGAALGAAGGNPG